MANISTKARTTQRVEQMHSQIQSFQQLLSTRNQQTVHGTVLNIVPNPDAAQACLDVAGE
jgi:hypothetical protein